MVNIYKVIIVPRTGLIALIQILLRGAYPKALAAIAALAFLFYSPMRASSQRV